MTIPGEKDGDEFKTGDNLHVQWEDARLPSGEFREAGFYRVELVVQIEGEDEPRKTSIEDGDPDTPGGSAQRMDWGS